MEGVWLAGLILACFLGVVLTVFRLPGTWVVVVASGAFAWHHDWTKPAWGFLAALVVLAIAAEVIEIAMSVFAAQRAGASRRASWGALIGGFVGMFVFTIPLLIVGTILGSALGCFVGAMIGEMTTRDDLRHGARVGVFAAIGAVLGTVMKTMIAVIMAGVSVSAAVFG